VGTAESASTAPPTTVLQQYRVVLQLVGGKTASQVYTMSFHTIAPSYQVHVAVPDHRMPVFESKEMVHRWHPLLAGLQKQPSVRMLVRIKPDGSGPLGDMCGCC
jgi:hypothetical protein